MKLHLPVRLLASIVMCMAVSGISQGEDKVFGAGTYSSSVGSDGTILSTFVGDCTAGTFGTRAQGYSNAGYVGGVPVDDADRFAEHIKIEIGNGETETILEAVVGVGYRGYASTGNKTIVVKDKAHAGRIYASYNHNDYHKSGFGVEGAESYFNNKNYFAPKAEEKSVLSVQLLKGGSALQIYGGIAQASTQIEYEMKAAEAALGSKEAADAYALDDPAWALNEQIHISVNGGRVGVQADGTTHPQIQENPGIPVIVGSGFFGCSVNNKVIVTVSGDSVVNGSIQAGASSGSIAEYNVRGYVGATSVSVSDGLITGNIYGGGTGGLVKGDTGINLMGGTINGDVCGAGDGDEVQGNTTITLSGDAEVLGTVYGGGVNGATVGGDKTLNLGTAEQAYNGTVNAADFSEINANNGKMTIVSYTSSADENNSLTLNVAEDASLTIIGDMSADALNINGGSLEVLNGELKAESVTLGELNYKTYNPGFVGGDENNGFIQDAGRETVGLDMNVGSDSVTDKDGVTYYYDDALGKYIAPGDTHWDTYYINTEDHAASVMELQEASDNQLELVVMQTGTLQADENIRVEATQGEGLSRGTINVSNGAELSGSVENTDVNISSGTVGATLTGTAAVNVTGNGTISGNNSQTGDTTITGPDAKLTVGSETALGDSVVYLREHGTLDLGGFALTNSIHVEGCTISGASQYNGDMTVSGDLTLTDATARAAGVMLTETGNLKGNTLVTRGFELLGGNRTIETNLSVPDGGRIVLHAGNALTIHGNLTLGKDVRITLLDGGYAAGDKLLTWTGTLTGDVNDLLLEADEEFILKQVEQSIILASESAFDQDTADVAAQGNWGIFTASRAFVSAVKGQRNNMGCIANGRGTAWASLLGGMTEISGSGTAAGSDITLFGAVVGVDMKVGKRSSLGVAFGYTDGEVSADGLGDIDQETGHIALYGEHGLKKFADNSCLSLDWVAATGTTESKYMGNKWEQDSVQLNARLSWNKQVTERFSYNLFGGVEYFASESDRVQNCKSGSVQNLRGELGAGVRYVAVGDSRHTTDEKSGMVNTVPCCERVVLYVEVSYINDMVRNNPSIEVNGLRGSSANPGRQGAGVEAGATIRIGERWSANANYSFNAMDDSDEHILNIGASRTF